MQSFLQRKIKRVKKAGLQKEMQMLTEETEDLREKFNRVEEEMEEVEESLQGLGIHLVEGEEEDGGKGERGGGRANGSDGR